MNCSFDALVRNVYIFEVEYLITKFIRRAFFFPLHFLNVTKHDNEMDETCENYFSEH